MLLVFLGTILPYLAAAVFLCGMAWRTYDWLGKPVPVPLTLATVRGGAAGRAWAVARELTLFSSLYRGDRRLWLAGWLMHASLALILLGHAVGIGFAAEQFRLLGSSKEASVWLSGTLGLAAGIAFAAALVALAYRRMAMVAIRRISSPGDYLALGMLLFVAGTGLAMRLGPQEVDLPAIRSYLGGLITLRPGPMPEQWLFVVHFTAFCALLLCFPFSKLVHLTGAIVTRSLVAEDPPIYPTPAGSRRGPWFRSGRDREMVESGPGRGSF